MMVDILEVRPGLVEEEDELGNKLCLVSNFSIPGPSLVSPGERQ